jgi:hypothetical protein
MFSGPVRNFSGPVRNLFEMRKISDEISFYNEFRDRNKNMFIYLVVFRKQKSIKNKNQEKNVKPYLLFTGRGLFLKKRRPMAFWQITRM